jgi:hypothetical protein
MLGNGDKYILYDIVDIDGLNSRLPTPMHYEWAVNSHKLAPSAVFTASRMTQQ